jgi:alkaline phosphatase
MRTKIKMLAVLLIGISPWGFMSESRSRSGSSARHREYAKHIILFIGDGMNIEHEIAASRYLYGRNYNLVFHGFPYQASVATWDIGTYEYWAGSSYDPDAISPSFGYDAIKGGKLPYPLGPELHGAQNYHTAKATDSAAAATAWATGYKTDSGNLAWLPGDPNVGGNRNNDGTLKTIAGLLRELKGYAIGVVSTVPFTHATPAAHVSHNKSRHCYTISSQPDCERGIDEEILTEVKPEVVIGGGHPGYDGTPTFDYMSSSIYNAFKNGDYSNEYVFVERTAGIDGGLAVLQAAQQAVAQSKKLFGLFGMKGLGNFESFEPNNLPGTPLVGQVTRENPALAEAGLAALKVLSRNKNGFFVMIEQGDIDWANHANDFRRMVGTTKDLHNAVQAIVDYVNQPGDSMDWTNTLLIVTADHSNSYMRNKAKLGAGALPEQIGVGSCGYGGSECTYPNGEVTYGPAGHTNELCRLYAIGAGTADFKKYEGDWYPCTKIIDNTHIFHMIAEAAGVPQDSPLEVIQAKPARCSDPR